MLIMEPSQLVLAVLVHREHLAHGEPREIQEKTEEMEIQEGTGLMAGTESICRRHRLALMPVRNVLPVHLDHLECLGLKDLVELLEKLETLVEAEKTTALVLLALPEFVESPDHPDLKDPLETEEKFLTEPHLVPLDLPER